MTPVVDQLPAIELRGLGKCYHLYDRPQDRLRQLVVEGLVDMTNRLRRRLGWPEHAAPRFYRPFWALKGVDLAIGRGETVGIIGRNGSGKSTLLQLVAGTLKPSEGEAVVRGRVAALLELGSGFNPEFTGRENVYLNGAILGLTRAQIEARFDEIAAFAGIGEFMDRPIKVYSSGMVVRLAFAVSVCVEPEILIVDEALAVGDAAFQFKCLQRVQALAERGTTLLFVSHDMGLIKTFCHRAVYLEGGRIKAVGDPEAIASQYLYDVRVQQRAELGSGPAPVPIRPLAEHAKASAFGDGRAEIRAASFADTGTGAGLYEVGQGVELEVDYCLEETLIDETVYLAVVIQTSKLLEIGGQRFRLPAQSEGRVRVRWINRLAPGDYFISLRIEEQVGQESYLPLVVQHAALMLRSTWTTRGFLGLTDLGMTADAGDRAACAAE